MAEIIGVIASGISVLQLAGQVAKSVVKLKDYWDQVKDVPTEITFLLREIESLNLILSHIKDDQSQQIGNTDVAANVCVRQSLKLCKDGSEELQGLVGELAKKIEGKGKWGRKIGSAKVLLKKEEIKRLKKRMKTAIRLLSLAYQFHTNAMIQLQPDIIVARVTSHMSSLMISNTSIVEPQPREDEPCDKTFQSDNIVTRQYQCWTSSYSWTRCLLGHLEYSVRTAKYKRSERQEYTARYVAPRWIGDRKAIQVVGYSELDGLDVRLKAYRIVPDNSPLFTAIKQQDAKTVRSLLDSREWFVTDRSDFRERTPLHMASNSGNVEILRMLLSEGADPLVLCRGNVTAAEHLIRCVRWWEESSNSSFSEAIKLLLDAGADDILIGEHGVLKHFAGSPTSLKYLQTELFPPGLSISSRARFDILQSLNTFACLSAMLFRYLISNQDQLDLAMMTLRGPNGSNIFHSILWHFAYAQRPDKDRLIDPLYRTNVVQEQRQNNIHNNAWRVLLRDCISATTVRTLTQANNYNVSPFHVMLSRMEGMSLEQLNRVVTIWLVDLRDSGIDLMEYGAVERENLLRKPYPTRYCRFCFEGIPYICANNPRHGPSCPRRTRLIKFSYGPEPEDWIFWFDEWTDHFAGIFWAEIEGNESIKSSGEDEVENESFQMPGSWVEADDVEDDTSSDDSDG